MINSNNTQANVKDQLNIVFRSFFEYPKTMKEVDKETGIMRESICRYVKTLRVLNKIVIVGYRKCKVTNRNNVSIYTTNPDLFPKTNQLKLFSDFETIQEQHKSKQVFSIINKHFDIKTICQLYNNGYEQWI